MIRLTWRQFRTQAVAAGALVTTLCLALAVTGLRLVDLAKVEGSILDQLTSTHRNLFFAGIVVMGSAPALIGAFWGAPLVARELEAGTHRLVWNQSVTRTRWLATKLGVTVLSAAAAVGILTVAVSWWADPIDGATSESQRNELPSRLTPIAFAMRGVAPVSYAVFAVVLGVTLGMLLRRSVAAMALTLALVAALQVAFPLWVRPHLASPVVEVAQINRERMSSLHGTGPGSPLTLSLSAPGRGDWLLSNQTLDPNGKVIAFLPLWMSDCLPGPAAGPEPRVAVQAAGAGIESCFARLNAEGYRQRLTYQPASRFWQLQWTETALYLALTGLLAGLCFWRVRRLG